MLAINCLPIPARRSDVFNPVSIIRSFSGLSGLSADWKGNMTGRSFQWKSEVVIGRHIFDVLQDVERQAISLKKVTHTERETTRQGFHAKLLRMIAH